METQIDQLTKEFHAKIASEVNSSSFDQCKAVYADKEAPLNNEINKPHEVSFVQKEGVSSKVLPCQLPQKELNLGNFTLPYTIGSLNFYAMADLGSSINVIPKSMFEHLKLARLKKIGLLVKMADMTKRALIGIVKNVLVKIDKFFISIRFVVIDMLNIRNVTMILGRPFLATIHAEIDVFNKDISLGIRDDMVTFDMDKKIHNFTTPVGKIYMINSIHNDESPSRSNAPSGKSSRFEKSKNLHNENNYIQERSSKKTRILKADTNLPSTHFCKPVKQICNGILKYCYLDGDRESIKGSGLSFPEFLLVKYGESHEKELIWDNKYAEWCNKNSSPDTPTSRFTSVQEDYKPRTKDYPLKDWLLTKVGHTEVSEPVKRPLLKTWLIDSFQEELVKDPQSRSFNDYKWRFDLEIDQLADEYELGI
ncbi:reverse transcriptase domain-containing protein [Tanacetum coccineum]